MASKMMTGVVGIFSTPEALKVAARQVRDQNVKHFDAYTPFPVHGLEADMNIPRSKLPWVTLLGGLTGLAIAFALQTYVAVFSWPLNVGGKPAFSFPAFIPVMFELTVLIAGLSTAGGLFFLCGLPNKDPQIFHPDITNDKFALFIASTDANYKEAEFLQIMKNAGATETRVVK